MKMCLTSTHNSWPLSSHLTCFFLTQTKTAISAILGDLREGDYFNLITFSDKVQIWKKGHTVLATKQNIRDARDFVKKIVADGCKESIFLQIFIFDINI